MYVTQVVDSGSFQTGFRVYDALVSTPARYLLPARSTSGASAEPAGAAGAPAPGTVSTRPPAQFRWTGLGSYRHGVGDHHAWAVGSSACLACLTAAARLVL